MKTYKGCIYCKAKNPLEATFCKECGRPIQEIFSEKPHLNDDVAYPNIPPMEQGIK